MMIRGHSDWSTMATQQGRGRASLPSQGAQPACCCRGTSLQNAGSKTFHGRSLLAGSGRREGPARGRLISPSSQARIPPSQSHLPQYAYPFLFLLCLCCIRSASSGYLLFLLRLSFFVCVSLSLYYFAARPSFCSSTSVPRYSITHSPAVTKHTFSPRRRSRFYARLTYTPLSLLSVFSDIITAIMPSFCLFTALTALLGASAAVADIQPYGDINAFSKAVEKAEPRGFPSQTFRSADVKAPIFQVNSWDKEGVDDMPYIFIGTVYGSMHAGPMILDARDLSLVYADQQYDNTYFSDVQTIDGVPYLTFWEGIHTRGHANGHCLVFDQNYNLVYNVSAQGLHGALADMHEMSFTPDGTIIFSTYFNIPFDCRRVGGPEDALLMDSGFQEIDPKTNEVVFEWAASHHFDVAKTNAEYGEHYGVHPNSGFDFFHINSIQKVRQPICSCVLANLLDCRRQLSDLKSSLLHARPNQRRRWQPHLDPRRLRKPVHRPQRRQSHQLRLAARRPLHARREPHHHVRQPRHQV